MNSSGIACVSYLLSTTDASGHSGTNLCTMTVNPDSMDFVLKELSYDEAHLLNTGELKLSVDCGILSISDAGTLHITQEQMVLKRRDTELTFPMQDVQPLPAALLLLRHGDFSIDGQDAAVTVLLPPETTTALCTALVPQIKDLGMTFPESRATLTIVGGKVTGADLRVEAEVPFLVTTIPLTFTAELNIQ